MQKDSSKLEAEKMTILDSMVGVTGDEVEVPDTEKYEFGLKAIGQNAFVL